MQLINAEYNLNYRWGFKVLNMTWSITNLTMFLIYAKWGCFKKFDQNDRDGMIGAYGDYFPLVTFLWETYIYFQL